MKGMSIDTWTWWTRWVGRTFFEAKFFGLASLREVSHVFFLGIFARCVVVWRWEGLRQLVTLQGQIRQL